MPQNINSEVLNILKQLHEKTAAATNIPLDDTIVLKLEIPFSEEETACVYYLDLSSNTCSIPVSDLPESESLMRDFSELLKSSVSTLSLPAHCRVQKLFLSPRDGGKIEIDLEFPIPQPVQNSIASLVKQTLTSRIRSNSNIWISELWTQLSTSNPHLFRYRLRTDDKENFTAHGISTPENSILELNTSKYVVNSPNNISSNQIYELQHERRTPEVTIKRNLEKHFQILLSETTMNDQTYTLTKERLSINLRESTGELEVELSILLS